MPSGTIGSATGANNVTGVAADYTSIANWEAAIDGNNQTGTVIYIANPIDTSAVTLNAAFSGMLLTAHADAMVNAPTNAAATSRARVVGDGGTGTGMLYVAGSGWTIEKLTVGSTTAYYGYGIRTEQTCTIRRCGFYGTGTYYDGILDAGTSKTVTVSNAFFIGVTDAALVSIGTSQTILMYHCSANAVGSAWCYGSAGSGTLSFYACIGLGTTPTFGFFGTNSGATINGEDNVSEDTTAPGSASTKYARSTSGWFTNTSAGSEDLSLVAGKQGWWAANKDAIDQTGWPSDVGTDIVGTTRAAPIDPGVWQTPAAGGGTTRGMPFGTRSTAFNGGRTFAGVLR